MMGARSPPPPRFFPGYILVQIEPEEGGTARRSPTPREPGEEHSQGDGVRRLRQPPGAAEPGEADQIFVR